MIAIGFLMLFFVWLTEMVYGVERFPQVITQVFGGLAVAGVSLLAAGVASLMWQWLP